VRTAPLPAASGDAPARQSLELAARGALADGLSWSGTIDRMVVVLSSELTATLALHPRRSPRRPAASRWTMPRSH
jgi:translocation and assembly module TamB